MPSIKKKKKSRLILRGIRATAYYTTSMLHFTRGFHDFKLIVFLIIFIKAAEILLYVGYIFIFQIYYRITITTAVKSHIGNCSKPSESWEVMKSEILKYAQAGEVVLFLKTSSLAEGFILTVTCASPTFCCFFPFLLRKIG